MKSLFFLIGFMIISLSHSFGQNIIVDKNNSTLQLPDNMKQILYTYEPDFISYEMKNYEEIISSTYQTNEKQLPWAIIGDFNGDEINDVVIDGHNNKLELLIAILSKSDSFFVHEINRAQYFSPDLELKWSSLSYVPRGTILRSNYEENTFELTSDAFELSSEKGTTVYYFKDGKFLIYVTSD